jgi:hypothetical protein
MNIPPLANKVARNPTLVSRLVPIANADMGFIRIATPSASLDNWVFFSILLSVLYKDKLGKIGHPSFTCLHFMQFLAL